jgi:hypothetical protein
VQRKGKKIERGKGEGREVKKRERENYGKERRQEEKKIE